MHRLPSCSQLFIHSVQDETFLLWITGTHLIILAPGLFYGQVKLNEVNHDDYQPESILINMKSSVNNHQNQIDSIIENIQLLPFPENSKGVTEPISSATTDFHFLLLVGTELLVLNRLDTYISYRLKLPVVHNSSP